MFPTSRLRAAVAVVALAVVAGSASADLISIATVQIGDAGNHADAETGLGAVSYVYDISTTEVTVGQYVAFLNAVAHSDPHGLFNTRSDSCTQITRSGVSGAYVYTAVAGKQQFPIARVSWYDAARFVNWLHNGQQAGPGAELSTETGAYDLSLGESASRLLGARYALPTTDEWYKAAYYDPQKSGGSPGYWNYATGRDTAPYSRAPSSLANRANYEGTAGYAVGDPNYYTNVGAYTGSGSHYGTFDQAGNVGEWTEQAGGGYREIRGGSWDSSADPLRRTYSAMGLIDHEYRDVGFRIVQLTPQVSTPEPATLAMVSLGGLVFAALNRRSARRPKASR